jgi:hypothetical protein
MRHNTARAVDAVSERIDESRELAELDRRRGDTQASPPVAQDDLTLFGMRVTRRLAARSRASWMTMLFGLMPSLSARPADSSTTASCGRHRFGMSGAED